MMLPHQCPECGEHDNIGVNFTVSLWSSGEPPHSVWPVRLIFTFTCYNCHRQWTAETDDFDVDEGNTEETT